MLDLGTSFVASVARDPNALAIVDDGVRLTYAQWYGRISSLVAAFDRIGLKPGDHLVTVLQNCEAAATLHWACQLAGIVITPINWRAKADELDFCIENSEARAVVYQDVSAAGRRQARGARRICRAYLRRAATMSPARSASTASDRGACGRRRRLASAPKPGRSCSTRPAPHRGPKACRGGIAPSGPRQSPMSRKISTGAASARSA